jgi:hypothetical protein
VPGFQRGLRRCGHPGLQGGPAGVTEVGARGGAEKRDRTDQVIGQLGDVVLGADRRAVIVGFGDIAQGELADGQRRLGGRDRIELRWRRRPLVGPGVTIGRGRHEPVEVVVPAAGVAGLLVTGQSLVNQADERPARRRLERDDHGRRSRRQVGRTFPAPAEHDAPARLHLGVAAGRRVPGHDGPPVVAAGPQVDARGDDLPAAQAIRLGDQGKGIVRTQRHEHRLLEGHRGLPSLRVPVAAQGRRREHRGPAGRVHASRTNRARREARPSPQRPTGSTGIFLLVCS